MKRFRYSLIGISLVTILIAKSCTKRADYAVKGTYVYVNQTDSLIGIKSGVYDFSIAPKNSYTIEELGDSEKNTSEKNYVPPMTSAVVIFNNFKCDTLDRGSKAGEG